MRMLLHVPADRHAVKNAFGQDVFVGTVGSAAPFQQGTIVDQDIGYP